MFRMLQKILINITMSLGVLLVALVTTIGGFFHFGYDKLTTWMQELNWGADADAIKQAIQDLMNDNSELLQTDVGLGMFISGIIILAGIVVFGILSVVFSKKAA